MNAQRVAQLSGPALAALTWWMATQWGAPEDMVRVLSAAVWMLVWWVSEAVPLGATSVLPLVLFPMLGVAEVSATAAPYGSKFVFLFMGGFLIALALERWNLHRRFALHILVAAGGQPRRLLAGFMLATAALSMWISNTATTLMMLPIALSVLSKINLNDHPRFPVALLLGTAYAANLGGIATLVGTPPNVAMAGLVEEVGLEVPFLEWSLMALPFSALMLYVLLTRVLCRVSSDPLEGGAEALRGELEVLGAWSQAERRVAWVFGATALLWVARRALVTHLGVPLNDTTIAMAAGLALFVLPSGAEREGALLAWTDTARLPWDILLLFGGGLTLAGQLSDAGVLDAVAEAVSSLPAMSPSLLIAGFVLVSLFLTEVMSNLALTVVMVPVVAQIALSWDMNPLLLVVPVTMASSCAFMLPMATPPNAIVFGSGRLRMSTMVRVGVVLNLVAAAMAWLWACWILPSWVQLL
jgi:sodium-dependent dicarboxylate transporter 2/3/5